MPTVLVALGAEMVVRGAGGASRTVAAGDFFKGLFTPDLAANEVLTEVRVPATKAAGWSYIKFHRRAQDWALVGRGRGAEQRRRARRVDEHGGDTDAGRRRRGGARPAAPDPADRGRAGRRGREPAVGCVRQRRVPSRAGRRCWCAAASRRRWRASYTAEAGASGDRFADRADAVLLGDEVVHERGQPTAGVGDLGQDGARLGHGERREVEPERDDPRVDVAQRLARADDHRAHQRVLDVVQLLQALGRLMLELGQVLLAIPRLLEPRDERGDQHEQHEPAPEVHEREDQVMRTERRQVGSESAEPAATARMRPVVRSPYHAAMAIGTT